MKGKAIRVEETVWARLTQIKLVERKKSLNDVIVELLEERSPLRDVVTCGDDRR